MEITQTIKVPSLKQTKKCTNALEFPREFGFQINKSKILTKTKFVRISQPCLQAKKQT